MTIRVALIEDHQPFRKHLTELIGGTTGFECVGAHRTAESALKSIAAERPDVVVLDLELPDAQGEAVIRGVGARRHKCEILVLTIHDEPKRICAALEAGASGYLVKPISPAKLLEAIVEVHEGGSPMSPAIARLVVQAFRRHTRAGKALEALTDREEEILALLAKGFRYQEIATDLSISVRTVSTHIHHIYQKLQVRSATQAAARYLDR